MSSINVISLYFFDTLGTLKFRCFYWCVLGEMMMSVLWFYRPEHAEGARLTDHLENEVFAAKHRDEILVACIEDRGYVLTYNEYCR